MNKINRQIKKELEMSNCKSTREYVRKMIELVDNAMATVRARISCSRT